MAKKTADIKDLDLASLVDELRNAKQEALNLRFRNATGQLENTAAMRKNRRQIGRINTLIRRARNRRGRGPGDEVMSEEVQADEVVEETAAVAAEAVEAVEAAAPVVAAPVAKAAAPAAEVEDDDSRANRKVREGIVVSDKMDLTAVVAIVERVRHPKYAKFVNRTKRLYAHDVNEERARIGDRVRIMETRPLSKLKRWRVVEILERAK